MKDKLVSFILFVLKIAFLNPFLQWTNKFSQLTKFISVGISYFQKEICAKNLFRDKTYEMIYSEKGTEIYVYMYKNLLHVYMLYIKL